MQRGRPLSGVHGMGTAQGVSGQVAVPGSSGWSRPEGLQGRKPNPKLCLLQTADPLSSPRSGPEPVPSLLLPPRGRQRPLAPHSHRGGGLGQSKDQKLLAMPAKLEDSVMSEFARVSSSRGQEQLTQMPAKQPGRPGPYSMAGGCATRLDGQSTFSAQLCQPPRQLATSPWSMCTGRAPGGVSVRATALSDPLS